jgi:hypothetical protein
MIPQKTQRRVPTEGLDYQGHICHVFVSDQHLIISVLVTDRDLTNYTTDFWEKDPVRINQLTERVLQLCEGRATGLNETLLGQPVTLRRTRGRLQLRKPLLAAEYKTISGAEFADSAFSVEVLKQYPMLNQ